MKRGVRFAVVLVLAFAFFVTGCIQKTAPEAQPTAVPAETEPTAEPSAEPAGGLLAATPAPTPEPSPEPTAELIAELAAGQPEQSLEAVKTVSGVVVATATNTMVIRMENGNTISFALSYFTDSFVRKGDTVTVAYEGDITSCPEVTGIAVIQSNPTSTITGTVMTKIDNDIFVQITSSDVIRFSVTKNTVIIGQENVVRDDTVEVTFEGDLFDDPEALEIMVVKANPDRRDLDPSLLNKELTGVVTKLTSTKVTIITSKSNKYSFRITGKTAIEEKKYDLEVNARIRVTYDGYASDTPDAKKITVLAPSDPTPTVKPNKIQKITGSIVQRAGNSLVVKATDGIKYSFLLGNVTVKGDLDAKVGDTATVSFYYDADTGRPIATEITYKRPRLLDD